MKVLIADDNLLWAKVLRHSVASWGYEPVVVRDGQQAWEILQRDDAPRLVILDWQMPGMDGIDVCRQVKFRQDLPFTYVMMLSARDAPADMVAGLDAGADDYLTKPIEPELLRRKLVAARRIVERVPPNEWSKPRVAGYDVQRLLGKGAFATVWAAVQEATGTPVALKIIRFDLASGQAFGRFAREIQLLRMMSHPNIARIYDSRIDPGFGYYAMELIDGPTLNKYVQERPKVRKLLALIAEVCDALDHAHRQGVLHRDLKPSNILVTGEGRPKLVDFGLGKSLFQSAKDSEDESVESVDGCAIGTPLFMAPEQARGENQNLDARTDVYALGIVLYVLLLRRHPHRVNKADDWETLMQIADGRARPPSEIRPDFNRELERIVMKALAREPDARYQSAAEFGTQLRSFLAG